MRSFVNFQVFRSSKNFAARWEWTRERFFAGVHSDVIDQFVFGFERSSISRASGPEACVRCEFGATYMFNRQMCDDILHTTERFTTFAANTVAIVIIIVGGGGRGAVTVRAHTNVMMMVMV